MTTLNTIDEMIELLETCDDAYFNEGDGPLSDRDYDTLKRKAFAIQPSHPYFVKIGSSVRGGKVKLPYPMGSLNQIYEGEVSGWVEKYSLHQQNIIVSDKLDGYSCLLIYNNGKFSIAFSRGDGLEGADISRHMKIIPSVPKTVAAEYLVVRAEVIMKEDKFQSKYLGQYKNTRNMMAGAMNAKETELSILQDIDVVAYEIVAGTIGTDTAIQNKSKLEILDLLRQLGFDVVSYMSALGSTLSDKFLSDALLDSQTRSPYVLDGLVATVDNHAKLALQSNSSSLNPEHSIKYKVLDESSILETFVKAVHWEVSKSGYLKPRVEILPVELFGTTVSFATGFNAKFIYDNKIGPGAKITITKSGMVIPLILSVISPMSGVNLKYDEYFAKSLDAVAGKDNWEWNDSGVEVIVKDVDTNEKVIFKQVLDFFETYKIDLLKEATLEAVWKYLPATTYEDYICDICDLTESEWVKLVGKNGSRIYSSLLNRLGNSYPETFFGACKYMGTGFGVRKAKALLRDIYELEDVFTLTEAQIVDKEGFDTKTARMVLAGLPASKLLLDRLCDDLKILDFVVEQKTSEMKDVTVVMTGFRDAELQATIESMGGKVASAVSKKTTHVLTLNPDSGSSKLKKAKELRVPVITPDWFKQEFGL